MKICPHPKCGKTHSKPGIFCSRSCANSRTWSEEAQTKRIKSMKKHYRQNGMSEKQIAALKTGSKFSQASYLKRMVDTPSELLGESSRRRKILLEQDGKCNNCGLDEWLGKFLILELEHKDGDKYNNKRENLEALCPNCHSLTPTWRGRNSKYVDK